jgi:D-alanyl-D-alanine carboxypeptidase/D-alanyl-D-alanine-endopeptidase (penicillin-binding protein 4)
VNYSKRLRYGLQFAVGLCVVVLVGLAGDRSLATPLVNNAISAVANDAISADGVPISTQQIFAESSQTELPLTAPLVQVTAPSIASNLLAQNLADQNLADQNLVAQTRRPTGDFVRDTLSAPVCPTQLGALIDDIVNQPSVANGRWGIRVESSTSTEPLYSRNAEDFLIPASNIKLLTTAAALQLMDFTTPTSRSRLESRMWIINGNSDNYSADAMLSWIGGTRAVQDSLYSLGIDPAGYRQVDGSGLSRNNIAQPKAFVTLLKVMRSAVGSEIFYHSLPVGGVSGTLRNRFRGTPVVGKVHAKTGTLNGVRALSGYLEHPEYENLMFSIVVNQPGQDGSVLLQAIDQIVVQMSRVSMCE